MRVRYETWDGREEFPPERFTRAVQEACQDTRTRTLLEVGGGANPLLSLDFAKDVGICEYVVTDVSAEELAKAPDGYKKIVTDLSGDTRDLGTFDLIVSRTVAEHVTAAAEFHAAVFRMLSPGGRAIHYFPTLYEPAFVVNRLLPGAVSDAILQRIQPHRAHGGQYGKFQAYYRWCRGPTRRQLARLTQVGFEIDEYMGIFGHGYFRAVPPLDRLEMRIADWLARHPIPAVTAYALVTLRKPEPSRGS